MGMNISNSEWKIMEVLWEESPRTMTQITKELSEETGWTKHTVMTYLKRLEEKGALHFVEGEKAKLYYPDVKKEDAQLNETEEFLGKVFGGKLGLMLNAMVEQKALSQNEIEELYAILEKGRNQK